MFKILSTPLEKIKLQKNFTAPQAGALSIFVGLVRNSQESQEVIALQYEAFEKLCRKEADQIIAEAKKKFHTIAIRCFHRVGQLKVGDMAVWIGVLAPHRDESFKACRYLIDEIKSRLPIWKKEYYKNGDSGWVNCQSWSQSKLK